MSHVVLGWMSDGDNASRFTSSLFYLGQWDAQHEGYLVDPGGAINLESGPRVAEARSQVVDKFGEPQFAAADWLFFLDSDMTFKPDVLSQLMSVADPETCPIVGGLCFAGGRSGKMYPTLYKEGQTDEGHIWVAPVDDYPPDTLVKVGATGGACMLIHRQVLAAMKRPYPKGFGTLADGRRNPYPWFVEGLIGPNGEPYGEDVAFCMKARQLGIPVHVHTGIKLGHMKSFELNEAEWHRYKAEQAMTTGTRQERRAAARKAASNGALVG